MRYTAVLILLLMSLNLNAQKMKALEQLVDEYLPQYKHDRHRGCGFGRQVQYLKDLSRVGNNALSKAVNMLRSRPSRQFHYTSPSGHFKLHYNLEGVHSVDTAGTYDNGVPAYIDSAAKYLDHSWQTQVEKLGFRAPLNNEGKPTQLYDVYFSKMSDYGVTWMETEFSSGAVIQYASYLELNTNYSGFYSEGYDGLKVTAAHEFNHACQLAYHIWGGSTELSDLFFLEMTSTWLEDYTYNGVNDYYQYLPNFFNNFTRSSFTSIFNTNHYANSVYLHFLEQLFGEQIIVDIWRQIVNENAIKALDTILKGKGQSFPISQNIFAGWMYFTGARALPNMYFEEAAHYPMLDVPLKEREFSASVQPRGVKIFQINNRASSMAHVKTQIEAGSGKFNHIVGNTFVADIPIEIGYNQQFTFSKEDSFAVLTLNNNSDKNLMITYQLESYEGEWPADSSRFNKPFAASAPFVNDVTFVRVPPLATIYIYDVLGRKVKTIKSGETYQRIKWNLQNSQRKKVASGQYFFKVVSKRGVSSGKILIVR
jgi:hypothetical protein